MKHYSQYAFSIKEIADFYHVSTRTIRFYEDKGLLEPKRLENQYRVYDLACLDRLETIISLKRSGLSLESIKSLLNDELDRQEVYRQQKSILEQKIKELKNAEAFIEKQEQMLALLNAHGLNQLFTVKMKVPEKKLIEKWHAMEKGIYVEPDDRIEIGYDVKTKQTIGLFQSSSEQYEQNCAFYFFVQDRGYPTNHYISEMIDLLHLHQIHTTSPVFISTYGGISKALVTLAWCKIALIEK